MKLKWSLGDFQGNPQWQQGKWLLSHPSRRLYCVHRKRKIEVLHERSNVKQCLDIQNTLKNMPESVQYRRILLSYFKSAMKRVWKNVSYFRKDTLSQKWQRLGLLEILSLFRNSHQMHFIDEIEMEPRRFVTSPSVAAKNGLVRASMVLSLCLIGIKRKM